MPIDGLTPLAEEIVVKKEKKKVSGKNPYQRVEVAEQQAEQSEEEEEEPDSKKSQKR